MRGPSQVQSSWTWTGWQVVPRLRGRTHSTLSTTPGHGATAGHQTGCDPGHSSAARCLSFRPSAEDTVAPEQRKVVKNPLENPKVPVPKSYSETPLRAFADSCSSSNNASPGRGVKIWAEEVNPPLPQAPEPPGAGTEHLPVGSRTGFGLRPWLSAGPLLGPSGKTCRCSPQTR